MAVQLQNIVTEPSLRALTAADYGRPKPRQRQSLQDAIRPHIDSFDYVVLEGMAQAAQAIPPVSFDHDGKCISLVFLDARLSPALVSAGSVCHDMRVFPAECRGRRTTYRGKLMADISWSVNGIPQGVAMYCLGQVPIMVKSQVCNLRGMSPKELIEHHEEAEEMGGYFICNGNEKVIRMLIMPRRNYPIPIKRPKWQSRGPGFTAYGISIRCVRDEHSAINLNLHYLESGSVVLNFIFKKELYYIPLGFVLRALVNLPDFHLCQELLRGKEDNTFLRSCVVNMLRTVGDCGCITQNQALSYLGERFRVKLQLPEWYTNQEVSEFLFSQCLCIHLNTNMEKFQLLCFMTQKLFAFAKGECAEENPDSPLTQEVMTSGHLYLLHLKEKMENWLYSIKIAFEKRVQKIGSFPLDVDNMTRLFSQVSDLSRVMEYLLATGTLRSQSGLGMVQESGLVVVADKLNSWRYLSHFRSVHRGASFASVRTTTVRRLLPAAWGFLCPVHTPDGTPCGLLNHLAAPCTVSSAPAGALGLPALLCSLGMEPVDGCLRTSYSNYYPVLLDGAAVGWLPKDVAPVVANTLRAHKVHGDKVPSWMEIVLVPMLDEPGLYPALYLFTSPGRLLRPVWNLALNAQELIGTFEQIYLDVAVRAQEVLPGVSTHQELYPHAMLSIIANFIPFSDHNQSPRNMYECQMGKQTMGMPLYTFRDRTDNKLYRLQTPQSPLVRPYMYDYYGMDEYPLGTNAVVAVISYTGYDMEDAMVVNKAAWDRGFAHGSIYKTELLDLSRIVIGQDVVFGLKPGKSDSNLDSDGLPPIGTRLDYGAPYYAYINLTTGECTAATYKSKESSVVDNIKACGNDAGTSKLKKVCITLRIPRNPMVGDKFASRHGQKGILSKLWPVEDMPFSESGMVPDIIFNPHGFPSRMTIGMLIESMAGKSAAMHGLCHDATPFTFSESEPGIDGEPRPSAIEHFGELLRTAGYNHLGTERMYSGLSGLELEADIFVGIVYYQRLRHMVSDKYQVRTTGARDRVTCQPVGGRQMQGGVRFGEMERDALLAHGTSFLLHDRLLACSDRSLARVCTRCCSLLSPCLEAPPPEWAQTRLGRRTWICKMCHQGDAVELITIPFVFRYFIAEMAAINVRVHLNVA